MIGRVRLSLWCAAIAAGTLASRHGLREFRLSRQDGNAAVSQVFSTREQIAASILGGFRTVLINLLWVRISWHIENQRFLELPLYFQALEQLQGSSPALFRLQANQMVFDIAREFEGEEEKRWQWIRRGLEVLENGNRRFPGNYGLLRESGSIYYNRFHPERCPVDRDRFLKDRRINPRGEDPLDLAIHFMEAAIRSPLHSLEDDRNLWVALRLKLDSSERAGGPERSGAAVDLPPQAVLDKAFSLLEHLRKDHGFQEDPEILKAQDWLRGLERKLKNGKQH
jgi:hypothetical protein